MQRTLVHDAFLGMDEGEDLKQQRLRCLEQNCSFRRALTVCEKFACGSGFLILSRSGADDPREQAGEMALIAKAQIGGDLRDRLTGRQLGFGGLDAQLQLIAMGWQTDLGPKTPIQMAGADANPGAELLQCQRLAQIRP